ncbi:hypothetical protein GJ700_27760 [Duganella sp. FT92W]|uniref:HEAT repeat domain-containing protein n=1 Tax=Pseudoduganella rivuli TaxID=2666085 RepID=A0A7X2ISY7_9BURK|nr:hypothetical protein [Pseudoduganella rivuli]MRV75521.1 hypothetical protein [Pseudoduganella rivuli]
MLQEYFDELSKVSCRPSTLLDRAAVLEQSEMFAFHPAISELHAYILDEENTSNHHLLITAGPLAGSIYFLCHDGESRVVFKDSKSFLNAVCEADSQEISVEDIHPVLSPLTTDQASLSHFLKDLLLRGEYNDLVTTLVPSLDLQDLPLLKMLALDPDFFLGEAVAREIEKRPSADLFPIAAACAEHPHPQVARAGMRALQCIERLR